ncbi:MAG TPA: heavy metal translocating P-type ATPase metal-binding domain-containing protein [Saprospiraceae bacterium]|nr:heavy metal translocating P-type ATPase metal-binding domain-containing protein [Saprospiraceae bacterium]
MAVKTATTKNNSKTSATTSCFHCGEPCATTVVPFDDKGFCCEGCRTVYEILNANDLCRYYDLDDQAGWNVKAKPQEEYAYLDDEQVQARLIDFTDGETTRVHFEIPQIHCASCIWLLEKLYKLNEGILSSKVNFLQKTVYIQFDETKISLRKLVEVLNSIGYAPAIRLKDLDESKHGSYERQYIYKLGVAGFAFGNIMLLSFPEYLGLDALAEGSFARFFGYMNIFLALPVLFYSGSEYLRSAWRGLMRRELNIDVPIAIGILTLFLRSVYEILSHTGAGYLDSLAGLVFFLLIGKWFQQRTYHRIAFDRDYRSYFPIAANKVAEEKIIPTSLDKLQIGDQIVIKNGELIPADAVLEIGEAHIDYSFVTGESEPVRMTAGEKLFAGGRQVGDPITVRLIKSVSQSYLTSLWNEEAFVKDQETQASKLANKVGTYFTVVILLIAFATLLFWLPRDMSVAINAFTAVLIIACPCAVALAIPFIFGNVLSILGRQQFFMKNTNVIEALDNISAVIFDKTGTLTNRKEAQVSYWGAALGAAEKAALYALSNPSNHPKSQAIAHFLSEDIDLLPKTTDWSETTGKGVAALIGNQAYQLGSGSWLGVDAGQEGGVFWSKKEEVQGAFQVQQSLREGTDQLFAYWRPKAEIHLLSGDNPRDANLFSQLLPPERLHFQQSPHDKLAFIQEKQKRHQVLMFGDGLNDAGALKQSDVGIVITENTNNFTPASDAILAAEQFDQLPRFLAFAKKSIRLVYGAYGFAFIYNIIGLSFAVQGTLSPVIAAILMPLSSISIALYGLLSSSYLAWKMNIKTDREKVTG